VRQNRSTTTRTSQEAGRRNAGDYPAHSITPLTRYDTGNSPGCILNAILTELQAMPADELFAVLEVLQRHSRPSPDAMPVVALPLRPTALRLRPEEGNTA